MSLFYLEMVFAPISMLVRLHSRKSVACCSLALSAAFSATPEERATDIQKLGFVTAELARAGAAVITAVTAPKSASRDTVKDTVLSTAGPGGNFFTIHVDTPLEYCEATDRQGVYAKARNGELKGVAGIDEVYEAPERADLTVDLTIQSVPEIVTSEFSRIAVVGNIG